MEFFGNIFAKENNNQENENQEDNQIDFNNEIELKSQLDEEHKFKDKNIRNLLRRSNIKLADYKVYDKVKNLYINVLNDAIDNVNKITFHRKGNVVNESDMYLMQNLANQNMFGGTVTSYLGYCDNNPGQCSDSFSGASGQCGGGSDQFCDGHPSQCGDLNQQGGFREFCDGHPSQCGDLTQQGGFIEFKNNDIQIKQNSILSKKDFINLAKERSQYKITNGALNKLQQFVENEVVNYLNKQKENQNSKVFNDFE